MVKKVLHSVKGHEFYFFKKVARDRRIYKCDVCGVRREIYLSGHGVQSNLEQSSSECWLGVKKD